MLFFNKNLLALSFLACTAAINCNATETELSDQIPDVSEILPPIKNYQDKMQSITAKYKDVFKERSKPEARQRIDNAKQKALNFYADIFKVKLSEVEKYSANFTTAQYLTWVAKEIINNGAYEFAKNEDELVFDGIMDAVSAEDKSSLIECFTSNSENAFPSIEKAPELCKIRCTYNSPNFESTIVHETAHVLDYAYRARHKIRSTTMDLGNRLLCEEAVSVFFETMYLLQNDKTFILEWLIDLYQISFEQAYLSGVQKRGQQDMAQAPETYKKVSELLGLPYYDGTEKDFNTENAERFMKETAEKHPELSFLFELWNKQAEQWGLTILPLSSISIPSLITEGIYNVLYVYQFCNSKIALDVVMGSLKMDAYCKYIPHVYRTMKIFNRLNSSQSVLDALDLIVKNVPDIMTEAELKDFIQRLDL